MRLLELVLIVVVVGALIVIRRTHALKVSLACASLTLGAFLMHAAYEGLRYQLLGVYAAAALLALTAAVEVLRTRPAPRARSTRRAIGTATLLLLIASSVGLAAAFPVFTLPQPTGRYAVGTTYLHLVDERRAEPFLAGSKQRREVMVKIYYPAQPDATKPYAPYFQGSRALLRLLTSAYQLPVFLFDHLRLVQTHAQTDLAIAASQPTFPVVLFSHGGGTTMEVHTAQGEDLASHGYIVVAIDYPYVSVGTVFPDRIVSAREATTTFTGDEPVVLITQIMVADAEFVLDSLAELNAGALDSRFLGKLDLANVGAIGHSLGGAVAYDLALTDRRVKAAINLDGSVYIAPRADGQRMAPFLMLANDTFHLQALERRETFMQPFAVLDEVERSIALADFGTEAAYTAAYERSRQNVSGLVAMLRASGNLYTIAGSDHMKFSDIGLFIGLHPVRELIGIHGATAPATCLAITEAVTVAFFDQHLQAGPESAISALQQRYPALRRVALP